MSTLVVVLVALAASNFVAAPSTLLCQASTTAPEVEFYDLMDKGVAARDQKHFAEAAKYMTQAYEAMPPEQRTGVFGGKAVREALDAHRAQYALDADRQSLVAAEELLERYFLDLERLEPRPEPSDEETYLQKALVELESLPPPDPSKPVEDPGDTPPPEDPPPPSTHEPNHSSAQKDDIRRRASKRGVALIATGASVFVGGGVLLVQGLRFPDLVAQAKQKADDQASAMNGMIDQTYSDTHVAEELRKGKILLGGGAGAVAIGAALTTWGAVWFVKDKKAPVAAIPMASRSLVGLSINGRF